MSPCQREVIAVAAEATPLQVSDISLREVALLYEPGRIRLTIPLRELLEKAVAPAVAAELASLPESFHRDPADRILVAIAK